jgi:Tfp pilus assembly protein PilF
MKNLILFFLIAGISISGYSQPVKDGKMPVTTGSAEALSYYNKGMKSFDDVALNKASDLFMKSLKADPDFFMANFQMAIYYGGQGDPDSFLEYIDNAIRCKAQLSQAEELLRGALRKLKDDINADVTETGKKLVEMYPNDINAYNILFYFQTFVNDLEGELETMKQALKIAERRAPVYNQLGYVYLGLKQNDKAGECFDKYIELDPENPNVYDSKGDFFMVVKEYRNAYESYMKAYMMDTTFSIEKARRAKQIYEMTEGKKIDVISM